MQIEIKKLCEAGHEAAMIGLSLNRQQPIEKMPVVAKRLAFIGNGESKFLEQIDVWLLVRAPRYWWQEADTYRLTSKNSESTRKSEVLKRDLTKEDFEDGYITQAYMAYLNTLIKTDWQRFKCSLPEGYLQKRMWKLSYMTLQNIVRQRSCHPVLQWRAFVEFIRCNVDHPEYLFKGRVD